MGNFLLGFGLGLVGGVLFAPRSGEDTRGYIGSKANEGVDYVKRQSRDRHACGYLECAFDICRGTQEL